MRDRAPRVDVCIVGAGLAGLVAARRLTDAGLNVVVVERDEAVGGRLSTVDVGGATVDTGAQFFTVRSNAFAEVVNAWRADGCDVRVWGSGFPQSPDVRSGPSSVEQGGDGHPRYVVAGGMQRLGVHLAGGLRIRTTCRVTALRTLGDGLIMVDTERGAVTAATVVCTPPAPQILPMLTELPLRSRAAGVLAGLGYEPCLTLVAVLDRSPPLPHPGAVQFADGPVQWMADNAAKGVSAESALTVHAAPSWSRAADGAHATALEQLWREIMPWLGGAGAVHLTGRWWPSALPGSPLPERTYVCELHGARVIFGGDAFGGPRVEGATLSGLAAAEAVLDG